MELCEIDRSLQPVVILDRYQLSIQRFKSYNSYQTSFLTSAFGMSWSLSLREKTSCRVTNACSTLETQASKGANVVKDIYIARLAIPDARLKMDRSHVQISYRRPSERNAGARTVYNANVCIRKVWRAFKKSGSLTLPLELWWSWIEIEKARPWIMQEAIAKMPVIASNARSLCKLHVLLLAIFSNQIPSEA